jgi:hypothetical protein
MPILRRFAFVLLTFLAAAAAAAAQPTGEHGHSGKGFLLFSIGTPYPTIPPDLFTLDPHTGQATVWNQQISDPTLQWYWGSPLTYDAERGLLWGLGCRVSNLERFLIGVNPHTGQTVHVPTRLQGGLAWQKSTGLVYGIVLYPVGDPAYDWIPYLWTIDPDSGEEKELFRLGLPQDTLNLGAYVGFSWYTNMARTLAFDDHGTLYAGYLGSSESGLIARVDLRKEVVEETAWRGPMSNRGMAFHPATNLLYALGATDQYFGILTGLNFPPSVPLPQGFREGENFWPAYTGEQNSGLAFAPLLPGKDD